jgi:porphobilinogen synthase
MHDRLRLLRRTPALRQITRETRVSPDQFIYPIFVRAGISEREPIASMPGQYRWPADGLKDLARELQDAGVRSALLFGLPDSKDEQASGAYSDDGVVQQAIRSLKENSPEMVVMTDVCVCAYTPHGHCGVLCGHEIDNDSTLPLLAKMAVSHAKAGADIVAPSSMMDGQVLALRNGLDEAGLRQTPVMGYSAKFASAFYGPFRDAADSAPSFGDRASYQHEAGNIRHAKRELLSDISEGADIVMVKPGLAYLDVVRLAREVTDTPVAVYNVSGEYSMVKAAAERGWIDEKKIVLETMTAFRRAGADLIITYHALDAARWLS